MPFITIINGEPRNVRQATREDATAWLDSWTYSGPNAVKEVREVPADRWSDLEMKYHYGPRAFGDHGHSDMSRLTRENCSACCLNGYFPQGTTAAEKAQGPNVSNWQRDYVQARRVIPAKWRNAFYAYKDSDNEPWKAALELDIATYGVRFEQ